MGHSSYSVENRSESVRGAFYNDANTSVNDIFKQNVLRQMHEEMNPNGIILREARDSEEHPNTVPIVLGLDLTGSMGHIPHDLIKEGLPKLIGGIIQGGIEDATLMFVGVGDHETDSCPLQVGQFESGDEEMDMWLTRTYMEGGGGANAGESYHLAWYFAAYHTIHDAWEKRNKKGYLITIGDEPCLDSLSASAIKEIMGAGQHAYSKAELLKAAQEKYHVFHIHISHAGREGNYAGWKQLLGENAIEVTDYTTIPDVVKGIIIKNEDGKLPASSDDNTEEKPVIL